MDRVTSKTMDAYVEFVSLEEAMKTVERHQANLKAGRAGKLGERPVSVELSSQSALMGDLFPIAAGITWNGPSPQFKPANPSEPWDTFKGFISAEEMTMLVKHVEVPARVSCLPSYHEISFAHLSPVTLLQGLPAASV